MKRIIFTLFLFGSLMAQEKKPIPAKIWNFGFLDSKTGLSFVGYSLLFKGSDQQHFFIGGGTMLAAFTLSAGWTRYFNAYSFSTVSIQAVGTMGGDKVLPTLSLGVEKQLKGRLFIKGGVNAFVDIKKPVVFPFLSFDIRK
jgi:hypothetical protein|tara:strand:- start:3987 stop:4409 length:423 start_codon:yes stop_codon:yes gene_type:complete